MREIKFRAWDIKAKSMINEVWEIGLGSKNNPESWLVGDDRQIDSFELMQYTGLKDKNGKEIYEGDIVKSNLESNDWIFVHLTDKEDEDGFRIFYIEDIFSRQKITHRDDLEVIGNIYENSKLLEE